MDHVFFDMRMTETEISGHWLSEANILENENLKQTHYLAVAFQGCDWYTSIPFWILLVDSKSRRL